MKNFQYDAVQKISWTIYFRNDCKSSPTHFRHPQVCTFKIKIKKLKKLDRKG